jgi:hypothetical protein
LSFVIWHVENKFTNSFLSFMLRFVARGGVPLFTVQKSPILHRGESGIIDKSWVAAAF